MELIKINIIRPQIFQAGLHVRRHGLFCQPAALGGQHKLIPDALQGVAQVLLADGVAPGGVDVIDPRLHQLPDERLGPLRIDAEGTKALIRKLVEAGVNYIDTARGYTVSEEYLGYALEGIRDKFVLATKGRGLTKEAMAADVETSLKNLRTDYIDLYQFHNPSLSDLKTITGQIGRAHV